MALNRLAVFAAVALLAWVAALLLIAAEVSQIVNSFTLSMLPVFVAVAGIAAHRSMRVTFNLIPYFFGSIFIFFCIGVALWPIATLSPYEFTSLISIDIEKRRLAQTACFLGISLSITILIYSLVTNAKSPVKFSHTVDKVSKVATDRRLGTIGINMMFIALPIVSYRLYRELAYILEAGYLALYADGISSAETVTWALPFNYIFYTGFGLACAFVDQRKKFTIAAFMFLTVAFLDGMKGARGAVIVPILFCWWFYSSRFVIKLRLGRLLVYALAAFCIFLGLTISRDPSTIEGSASQFIVDAVATQGRSLQLTAIYMDEKEEVAKYGNMMITSNLMIPINVILHPELRDAPQSFDQVSYSNNLKHILTYTLNPDYYFAGGGTGGVYLIELIESGWILFVLFSAALGWFFARWPAMMRLPFWRFSSFQIFATVFYMPRAEFFPNMLQFGKSALIFILVLGMVDIAKGFRFGNRRLSESKNEI